MPAAGQKAGGPLEGIMLTGFKTYLGIALAAIGGLAGTLGVEPTALPEWADSLFVAFGTLLAFYGRWDKERRTSEGS